MKINKLKIILYNSYLRGFATCFFLMYHLFGSAQANALEQLEQKFNTYQAQSPGEKIYVHTDKEVYFNGEIIWFKVYAVNAEDHKPSIISKVAYVEIINSEKKPLFQGKIALDNGTGTGSFVIPSSLNSGNCILRAYTNWMKNFGPESFFEKIVALVNTQKRPNWQLLDKKDACEVHFFPEGGNMVNGIQSKVAFHVVDQYGKGVDCKGYLLNEKNDTLTVFESLKFGMGSFKYTPESGRKIKVLLKLMNDKSLEAFLPDAYDKGYVMSVAEIEKNKLLVSITTNMPYDHFPIYLLAHQRQRINAALAGEVSGGKTEFVIDKAALEEGVSNLTVFNSDRQPVCERLYFKRPAQRMVIDVVPDQKEYKLRSKVTLDLSSFNKQVQPLDASLSLSVFLVDSLQYPPSLDIYNYLWLGSEVKGIVESPDYYFQSNGSQVDEALDNLLLTQGWRRFRWEEMLGDKKPSFRFLPEYEGLIINGKVSSKATGVETPGIMAYLSAPGENFNISNAVSDEHGQLTFVLKKVYGLNELIAQATKKNDSAFRIDILNSFSENYSSSSVPHFDIQEKWKDQLTFHSVNTQLQNNMVARESKFYIPPTDTVFYGSPDKRYYLDDYTRFPTMEEVMREYIADVHVKKEAGKFHYEVQNIPYKSNFSADPLVLFDGVPVQDIDKIISFDPLKVKRIDVVARKYFLGNSINNGIVSYTTYQGDLAGFQLDPDAIVVEFQGLQLKREFYMPSYNNEKNNHLPDLRNVLDWSPDILTGEKGKRTASFYTSDVPGSYMVIVQGIAENGLAGNKVTIITVKK